MIPLGACLGPWSGGKSSGTIFSTTVTNAEGGNSEGIEEIGVATWCLAYGNFLSAGCLDLAVVDVWCQASEIFFPGCIGDDSGERREGVAGGETEGWREFFFFT